MQAERMLPRRLLATIARDFLAIALIAVIVGLVLVDAERSLGPTGLDTLSTRVAGVHHAVAAAMLGVTHLGEEIVLVGLSAAIVWWTYRRGELEWSRFFAVLMPGALLFDNVIKPFVARPRPDFARLVDGTGYSFPSGHVLGTTALLLGLCLYISWRSRSNPRNVVYVTLIGSIAMAASRVVVGVHWPTDVLVAIVLGIAWSWRCSSVLLDRPLSRIALPVLRRQWRSE